MTRIMIVAFGTRGDVAPLTGLGTALRDRLGAEVIIAAQHPYRAMISAAGLGFRLLPKDTEQATRDSDYGQGLVDGARARPSKDVLVQMRQDLTGVGEAMAGACADADLLLMEGPVGSLLGYHVAEALDIPSMGVFLQPASPTAQFAPPVLTTRSFGGWANRLIWQAGGIGEKVYTPLIDNLRRDLGLPVQSRRTYQQRRARTWPILYGYSRHVVPRPTDWRPGLEVTGYWWPADDPDWRPSAELTDFLAAGDPPVFVGLGSTATAHGERLSELFARALRKARVRAVIQSGWAQLRADGEGMLTIGDTPHHWLFPQLAAIVHHCGAGTTAAALRAGVPSVPVPGIVDQPFWGQRLHTLGAGTAPLRRISITEDELAAAVSSAVHESRYRERAQHLSGRLVAEDEESVATEVISTYLDQHRRTHTGGLP